MTCAEMFTTVVQENLREALTRAVRIEYQTSCMALLLAVVSIVATDPTRDSGPLRQTANVSESSVMRTRGATDGSTSLAEGGMH